MYIQCDPQDEIFIQQQQTALRPQLLFVEQPENPRESKLLGFVNCEILMKEILRIKKILRVLSWSSYVDME